MKYILNIAVALLGCCVVHAQMSLGGKAGISVPDLKGNTEQSKGYTSRLGVYGGVFVNIRFSGSFSLQPELNFSPQGGQRKGMQPVPANAISGITLPDGAVLYARFNSTTILNYLEVPVLAKLLLGNKLKYYICGGPHIAFLLEAKTKTSGNSNIYLDEAGTMPVTDHGNPLPSISFNGDTKIKESIKTINAGLQGGIGIRYPAGPGVLFLDGRAILGLTNIQRHPEVDGKNKTGSLAVTLGYLINIK